MKRRFLQTLITTFVMSSLIVTPVLATPQDDVKSLEQKKSQAEAQANNVNNELVGLLVDYDALQKDMQTQEKRIDDAEIDLKDAEAKEKQQYEDMKLRIKYMYEEGNAGLLSTLIRAESYADLVSKAEYVQKVHDYDRKMLDKYVETKNEVVELKGNLEEGQAEMQALSDEMVVQKENLETTLTQMRSQIEDFDSQLVQAKEAAAEELRRIEAEQRAAEEAEAAAREQQEAEEAAAAEQQAEDDSQQKEDSETEDNQVNPEPSDASDDKKDEDKKEESNPKPSKPSENDKDKEDSKDDAKDEEEDDEKQDDKTDDLPAAKPGNAALGQQIADMGCNYIGNKYVYGGTSLTNGIDCSGFVQQIHKKFGISTPRTSGAIRSGGKSVSYADRMPGDVICYSGHVGIYIGNNKIVHASNSAPYPKGGIKITSPANYRTVLAVRRYW
ncbi:hypothetical protein C818_00692 [Lachnospiraceae bacterium MD308]|nr:hypothetical protein C818_00692 [Lachnospiraceae bacterium MD308]